MKNGAEGGRALMAYYFATGSTEAVANTIADTFEITPANPYSSDDLNWRDSNSRVCREHDDPALRAMELAETAVDSFVNANDFTGKTVIPFCIPAAAPPKTGLPAFLTEKR